MNKSTPGSTASSGNVSWTRFINLESNLPVLFGLINGCIGSSINYNIRPQPSNLSKNMLSISYIKGVHIRSIANNVSWFSIGKLMAKLAVGPNNQYFQIFCSTNLSFKK